MEKELKCKIEVTENGTNIEMSGNTLDLGAAMCQAVRGIMQSANKLKSPDSNLVEAIKRAIISAAIDESGVDFDDFIEAKKTVDKISKQEEETDDTNKLDDLKNSLKKALEDLLG